MKTRTERIIDFIYNLSRGMVIFGVCAFFSLFFTPRFHIWRLLIAIIPIVLGSFLSAIVHIVAHLVYTTQAVRDNLKNRKDNTDDTEE